MEFIFQKGGDISFDGFKSSSPTSSSGTHAYAEYVRHVIHMTGSVWLQIILTHLTETVRGISPDIRRTQDWFLHHDKVPASTDLSI